MLVATMAGDGRTSPSIGDGPEPPSRYPSPAIPAKPGAARLAPDDLAGPPVRRIKPGRRGLAGASPGALSGKTVYLSAGHGWTYSNDKWRTQRGNTHDLVEDFITVEGVNQYLIRYLHNMGAYVVPIREADLSSEVVVVDDDQAELYGVAEDAAVTDTGWAPPPPSLTPAVEPFSLGRARTMLATSQEQGRAVFPVRVRKSGAYNVYVSWVQGADRAPDAHVIVRHGGGFSHLQVDQRRHGSTWVLLGRWWFDAGAEIERSSVVFTSDSSEPGSVISFDAVRVGGGVAVHDLGGGGNGRPLFEQSARYSTQLLGAPPSVYDYYDGDDGDDVAARPRYASWDHEDGEDAVYLAWHTNAPDPGRGTSSFTYGPQYPCCGGLDEFSGVAGSLELQEAVHSELIGDVRTAWDAEWRDRGRMTANFGELRPSHNGEMPSVLVELAFHSTPADADALRNPHFRRIGARAMAQGIARYFAEADGRELVLPPEPPVAVQVHNTGSGQLRVAWRPPLADPAGGDAAAGYRVYVSKNGFAFDDGVTTTDTELVLGDVEVGDVRYVRVAAENSGGESMPSEVVGARVAASGAAPVLIVNGFDRLDGFQSVRSDLSEYGLGTLDRMLIDRMNNGSYATRHGAALAAAGYSFDGASDEAIEIGDVDVAPYVAIDWFCGEDSVGDDPMPERVRQVLAAHQADGGALLISGSELIWALDDRGDEDDRAFARQVLRAELVADDAGTYQVIGLGRFADVAAFAFDDVGPGGYDADYPDVLAPVGAAEIVLGYDSERAAAIAWGLGDDGSAGRGVLLGFPFETVAEAGNRTQLISAVMSSFAVPLEPGVPEDPTIDDVPPPLTGGCGCQSGGAGGSTWLLLAMMWLIAAGRRKRSGGR